MPDHSGAPRIVELPRPLGDERAAVVEGLLANPARISPKYFYDEVGCALYSAICRLPEYYPTRTEIALFREERSAIAEAIGKGLQVVDLGAGDCCKAEAWLPYLAPTRYIAVDIAAAEITRALERLAREFPELPLTGVVTDFSGGLDLEAVLSPGPALFFYPGSSIGNFTPEEALAFLASVRRHCASRPGSNLLIGVDGKKDARTLEAAYDDALGVTAAFNLNVLRHVNRLLGSDFDVRDWRHVARFDRRHARIEMHVEARRDVVVHWRGGERRFDAGERIHTENSYKYRPETFVRLLASAGWSAKHCWVDDRGGFAVVHCAA